MTDERRPDGGPPPGLDVPLDATARSGLDTPLDAARAAERSQEAVRAGGTSVSLLAISGEHIGARLVLTHDREGREEVRGTLGTERRDRAAIFLSRDAMADADHDNDTWVLEDGSEVYVEVRRPVPELIIVGAGHIARPMARIGADLGFRVWVLDDRPDFATRERFPEAHRVMQADFGDPFRDVPIHGATHVLLITRGHKYDYDSLVQVLRADQAPAYIGMIGSRRRVRATFIQLLDDGFDRARLKEIHAPVGLDIGAETPEEIAVAVAAELIKVRRGGSGASLRDKECVAERFFSEAETEA